MPERKAFFPRVQRSAEEVQRDAHRPGHARPDHHWAFDYFPPQLWPEKAGHQTGWLGETFPGRFVEWAQVQDFDRLIPPYYPPVGSEYYELTDLLEAIVDAKETFTFVEAGAGFGRWSACAALAARGIGIADPQVIMIEGDPVHVRWAREMMALNGIGNFRLVGGALAAEEGKDLFVIDVPEGMFKEGQRTNPAGWYGQSIAGLSGLNPSAFVEQCDATYEGHPVLIGGDWRAIEIDTVTLADVITDVEHVDLIDMDIQGAEGVVIAASIDLLTRRVRRLCIETHSADVERDLRRILGGAGWVLLRDLPLNATTETPFGAIAMPNGGLQSWINPRRY